jgi:hypothetical protein
MDALIFVHSGFNYYVPSVLAQARRSNPKTRIVLLGDNNAAASAAGAAGVEFRDSRALDAVAGAFRQSYVHLSPNPLRSEQLCFERWFVIRDFCRAEKIDRFFCADSDVAILSDMAVCRARFGDFDISLSEGVCAHASYWSRLEVLERFCAYILDAYGLEDVSIIRRMLATHQDSVAGRRLGGVSDMTFLEWFVAAERINVAETTAKIDGRTFDNNINMSANGTDRFVMRGGLKDIKWHNGSAFGRLEATGEPVAFDILHCQGRAKRCIRRVCSGQVPLSPAALVTQLVAVPASGVAGRIVESARPVAKSAMRRVAMAVGLR